jgi:hypothetical protein
MRRAAAVLIVALTACGCTSTGERPPEPSPAASPSASPSRQSSPDSVPPLVRPADLRVDTATRAVRHLADTIGPRHGTSPAFRRAAGWVAGELRALGYDVRRQRFRVPGGESWGVPVVAGTSLNVIATAPGVDTSRPHLVVGAHLDTVPQAPGAEDNASGVGVLLAVARAVAERRTRLPVVLVAFGAEEPRGPTDDDHHYGSRAYVAALTAAERRAVRGMVSLDRVGVGDVVPVGAASGRPVALVSAARRSDVPVAAETGQRSSDHWSFVRAGLPGLRIGSTPYAAYHSADDVPAVVSRDQLARAGRLVLAWLSGPR